MGWTKVHDSPIDYAFDLHGDPWGGACCHACELISETTCGYQNKFLDRNIVRGTLEYD